MSEDIIAKIQQQINKCFVASEIIKFKPQTEQTDEESICLQERQDVFWMFGFLESYFKKIQDNLQPVLFNVISVEIDTVDPNHYEVLTKTVNALVASLDGELSFF